MARGLVAAGVEPGDRVALLSRTRYEWTLVDYAILAVGAATVPIYETSSAEQIRWILSDSGAIAVVVETAKHAGARRAGARRARRPPGLAHRARRRRAGRGGAARGARRRRAGAAVLERRESVRADDLATLIYTSGTTGRPKGCALTHRNMQTEVRSVAELFPQLLTAGGSVLLFLPLAHVFGKAIQCGATYTGTVIGHTADVSDLVGDLKVFRPTFLLAVPRVFEKVYNSACQRAHDDGKGKIFDAAADTAIAWSRARDTGGPGHRAAPRARAVRPAGLRQAPRGRRRPGGGGGVRQRAARRSPRPLLPRRGPARAGGLRAHRDRRAGITVNTLDAQRVGSVGRPVPGHAVRIDDDGEILIKGPNVFRGYWKNDTATAEAVTDGWFHTGDIGELDDAGFLTITGRKKELIVTAGGKNVAPAVLEDRLRAHPLVSQCMVVGDGKPFIAALVTVDAEALPGWLERSGQARGHDASRTWWTTPTCGTRSARRSPTPTWPCRAPSRSASSASCRSTSPRSGGEMTPTMKVKRAVVVEKYADDIAGIYAGRKQPA